VSNLPLAFFGGVNEWLIVLVVVIVLFGGTQIPKLMRGIGQGVGELKKGLDEGRQGLEATNEPEDKKS